MWKFILTMAIFCFVSVPLAFSAELVKIMHNDLTELSSDSIAANLERRELSQFAGVVGKIVGESRAKCGDGFASLEEAVMSNGCGFGGIGAALEIIIPAGKFAGWRPGDIRDLLVKFRHQTSERYMKVVEVKAAY